MIGENLSSWPRYMCASPAEVPGPALSTIRPEIVAQLGQPVHRMFPAFSNAFPRCVAAMEAHWAKPVLVAQEVVQDWTTKLVLEGPAEKNIFIQTRTPGAEIDGPEFEEYKAMLPPTWKELYRWFDSFGIVAASNTAGDWINTPFDHASRLELEEFRQRTGGKKADIRAFAQKIDSNKFRCWMLTDAGDSLWLDEQRCDHKVYYLRGGNFKDVGVLANPGQALDTYLAHVLSGGKPADFDFYKWRA